ncbi:MAG: sporulation protein YqfD [Clostridiales bacterium]|nr:sporulation protein YqfD [Clostridiales bacterium]
MNKIQISVEGFNQTRLINTLLQQDIQVFDLHKYTHSNMTLWIYTSDRPKLFAILQDLCYNANIITQDLTKGMHNWLIKRVGALLGAIVFFVCLVLSNSFVWRVNVHGLNSVPINIVNNILQAQHATPGTLIYRINKHNIKQAMLELDNVVDASIELRGTTLVVTIFENFVDIPLDPTYHSSIVSKYDAIVTRVLLSDGTSVVKPGDKVSVGSELISPNIYDTTGQILTTVNPSAKVYGNVSFSDSRFFVPKQIVLKRSGNSVSFNDIGVFGLEFSHKASPYQFFETKTTQNYLFGNQLLPIVISRTTYHELIQQESALDVQQHSQTLVQMMLRQLQIKAGTSELHQQVNIRQLNGGYRVDLFVTAEMLLS